MIYSELMGFWYAIQLSWILCRAYILSYVYDIR